MSFTTFQIPKELVTPYNYDQQNGSIKIIEQIDSQSSTLLIKCFDKLLAYSTILREWREIQVVYDGDVLDLSYCACGFFDSRNDMLILFFKPDMQDKDVLFFRAREGKYENYEDEISAMFPTKLKDEWYFIFRSDEFFVCVYEDVIQDDNMIILWHYVTGTCKKMEFSTIFSDLRCKLGCCYLISDIKGISQGQLYCPVLADYNAIMSGMISYPLITTVDLMSICFGSAHVVKVIYYASLNGMSLEFRKGMSWYPSVVSSLNESVLYYLHSTTSISEPAWSVKSFSVKDDNLEYCGSPVVEERGLTVGDKCYVDPRNITLMSNHLMISFPERYSSSDKKKHTGTTRLIAFYPLMKGIDSERVIDKFDHVLDIQSFGNVIAVVKLCVDGDINSPGLFNVSISSPDPKYPSFDNVFRAFNVNFSFENF